MDQTENKNIQTLNQFTKSKFLKKLTTLLLSVSLFSLLFAHSPLLSFLHSFNFHFSAFPFKLFSHTLDKNFIFLLCNGIIVFLAKFSSLISSSSSKYNRNIEYSFKNYEYYYTPSSFTLEKEEVVVESVEPLQNVDVKEGTKNEYMIEEAVKRETEKLIVEEQVQEEENFVLVTNEKEEEEEEEESDIFVVEYEEDNETKSGLFNEEVGLEEEEGNNELLSTEELNKKFDDFIRKMKEELRIEAQQQLVMV